MDDDLDNCTNSKLFEFLHARESDAHVGQTEQQTDCKCDRWRILSHPKEEQLREIAVLTSQHVSWRRNSAWRCTLTLAEDEMTRTGDGSRCDNDAIVFQRR